MTQFRVLPVRRGDAYLLQSRRGSYLVDGGAQGSLLPEMLTDRLVRKLRVAVCSSTCSERLGGILEIMEAEFPVVEYWFPEKVELVPEMAHRFNGDWDGWLKLLGLSGYEIDNDRAGWISPVKILDGDGSHRRLEGAAVLIGLAVTACFGMSPYKGMSRSAFLYGGEDATPAGLIHFFEKTLVLLSDRAAARSKDETGAINRILRRTGWRLFSSGSLEDIILLCGRLLNVESQRMKGNGGRGMRIVVHGLTMAAMMAAMLTKTESHIRFFSWTGKLEKHFVPRHPLICLNGVEATSLPEVAPVTTPSMIFQEIRRTTSQSKGLAFQYGDANCGALFCGNTKMAFLGRREVVALDRPTVIAAPRQGNCSSDRAYGRIVSKDPKQDIWVRSHYSYARKVSDQFKEKTNKLCLNNCVHRTVHEVLLSHSDGKWNRLAGASCICG